ncbi:MAG: diguanylate cyclase [Helicobacteraceae bacterium]|nr:diguanylate cyclase [Helicobacteraceae bacterium]
MNRQIIINFSVTIALLIILGITSIVKMIELADMSQKLYKHPYTVTTATKTIESNLISMHRYMKDVALSTNSNELQMAVDKVNKAEITIYNEFNTIFERYLGSKEDIQKSHDAFVRWKDIRDEVITLMKNGQKEEAARITKNKGAKHVENLNMQVHKLIDYAKKKAIFFNENAKATKEASIALIVGILIAILIITITSMIFLLKNISKTDKEIKKHFHLIDQNIMSATLNKEFKIMEVSHALSRHLCYTKEELLNTSINFMYSDCSEEQQNTITRIVQSGSDWNGEVKKIDSKGDIKWLHSVVHPIFDENYKVVGYTNIFHDISSKKQIEEISNIDGLTSLYNRRFFDNIFQKQISIASRNKTLLAYVMMDIDHFKQYNDTYGHQAGDQTLKKVADLLKKTLNRAGDYTFRLGGEEFGMLYSVKDKDEAFSVADKTRVAIEELKIDHSGNSASKYVTMSMGLYIIELENLNNTDEIYKLTDELLYSAKEGGRNRVVI